MVLEVFYSTGSYTFNIKNGSLKTTYADHGYAVVFKVNGSTTTAYGSNKGVATINGCTLNTTLALVSMNMFANVKFSVKCNDNQIHKIGIAVHADIQIGSNDYAPITNIPGDRGFIMKDGNNAVNMLLRDSYGSINVDNYWYGHYSDRTSHLWGNGTQSSTTYYDLTGVDSGMAFSWDNRIIDPGETLSFSFTSGIGKIMQPPQITMTKLPKNKYHYGEYASTEVSGYVYHPEENRFATVRYYVDGGTEYDLATKLDVGKKTAYFNGLVDIPTLSGGYHVIYFYAFDERGMVSQAVNFRFYVNPFPMTVRKAKKTSVNAFGQIAGLYSLSSA